MINTRNLFSALAITFLVVGNALAAEFAAPSADGDPNVTISAAEVRRDLYTAGANVIVNGAVEGDLFAAGGMISVIGDVSEDLNVVGGSLSVSGSVGDDARLAGGNITISAPIGGDLIIAGGNISITEAASIGGDLIIAGGNTIIGAPVKGSVYAAGGNITLNSKIQGNVKISSRGKGRNEGNVVFGPKAEVAGKIIHTGSKEAVVREGAKIGTIDFTLRTGGKARGEWLGLVSLGVLIKLSAWFLAGWVLVRYRRQGMIKVAGLIKDKPWENLVLGLAGLVVTPVIVILLTAALVGYYIAAILLVWYVLVLLFACLTGVVFLGAWLRRLIVKSAEFTFDFKTVVLGVVTATILKWIPVAGWLAYSIFVLMALGALLRVAKDRWVNES